MFKSRPSPTSAHSASPPPIEVVRQRAKHRLIGASVLVLAGVVLFPWLFDTQPRPIPVDIAIEIPSRKAAVPLSLPPASPALQEPVPVARPVEKEEVIIESRSTAPKAPLPAPAQAAVAPEPAAAAPDKPREKPVVPTPVPAPPPVVPKPALSDGARAQALLDGQAPPAPSAAAERFIVQVGAFAEAARAQQVRQKLERAGQKTYTHVADTPEGKRIRVRLGPFASRSDAEKAAAKAKALGLTPSVLTL